VAIGNDRSFDARVGKSPDAGRKATLLSTVLAFGTERGSDQNKSDIVRAMRRGTGDTVNQASQQIVRRNLNVQPTLTIRPGYPGRRRQHISRRRNPDA